MVKPRPCLVSRPPCMKRRLLLTTLAALHTLSGAHLVSFHLSFKLVKFFELLGS